jgi:hypothetical protein
MTRSPLLFATHTERDGATRIGIVRITVGALPLLAAGLARMVSGLPKKDDTPAVRTVARLFAIRNIVLGLWVLSERDADANSRHRCYQLNAAVDAVDVLVLVWPVVRRQGLTRFGLGSATLGVCATLSWLELVKRQKTGPTTAAPA